MKTDYLNNEWTVLQNQFDSYEKYSLLIKLFSIGLLSTSYILNHTSLLIVYLLLILWAQDAIWKTFQSRIETRLLRIEEDILNNKVNEAYQYNSQFVKNKLGGINLIFEYCRQAIRPTIAFPHVLLIFILAVELVYY